jgi:GNAT superfamily N-acetyltransferase
MAASESIHVNGVNGEADKTKPSPISADQLPSADSEDLILVPATQQELDQCQRLNAAEWKGPLTIDQYLDREKHLFSQELTKNGKAHGWILTSTRLPLAPDGSRQILSSCETILVNAYIARGGALQKVLVHGIGSVFCRKEHRGKGYAGRMMTELGKRLETWQQPNGDKGKFSVLYSDIGENFYSRFGWKVFPSTHIHLDPMSEGEHAKASKGLPAVQDVLHDDLQELQSAQYVEQELRSQSENGPSTTFVSIRPDLDHFQWHHAREEIVASSLGKPFPIVKGAIHKPTGIAVIWNRVFAANPKENQLHILHTIIPPEMKYSVEGLKALSALFLRAQLEAGRWDMQGGIEIWDPSDTIIAAAQNLRTEANDKVELIHRDKEHVCSLRWLGPGGNDADVVWLYNQKYAWC